MATKPKKIHGQRITTYVHPTKRNGLPGRPKGTKARRQFDETKLGFIIKYEAPLEYDMIMKTCPDSNFPEPDIDLIEAIANISTDKLFSKPIFWRYFDIYKRDGCFATRAMRLTPLLKNKYERVVENKIKNYIKAKRSDIKRTIIKMREVK